MEYLSYAFIIVVAFSWYKKAERQLDEAYDRSEL
jgi:hypothetical protein